MDWKEIIGELERYIVENGGNKSDLSKIIDVRPQFLADIKSGKSKNPNSDFTLSLITKMGVNPHWLKTGEGKMISNSFKSSNEDIMNSISVQEGRIPLLRQKVSCGQGVDWDSEQNIEKYVNIFSLLPHYNPIHLYATTASGTSMLGKGIQDGDIIIFNGRHEQTTDGIYVFSLDGEVYCKWLEYDPISKKLKIYSVRSADLKEAELLETMDTTQTDFNNRFFLFGRVISWIHPNFDR